MFFMIHTAYIILVLLKNNYFIYTDIEKPFFSNRKKNVEQNMYFFSLNKRNKFNISHYFINVISFFLANFFINIIN